MIYIEKLKIYNNRTKDYIYKEYYKSIYLKYEISILYFE